MSGYGGGAGFGSGDPWGSPSEFVSIMLSRLLMFVRYGERFRGIINAKATRTADLLAACRLITASFDLDTAVGAQLDRIGGIVQLARFGYEDDRYRTLLRVQIDILLSSTAGAETLLRVLDAITGAPATEYEEHYPAQFVIGGAVASDDVSLLRDFLRRARGWGIYGGLSVLPEDGLALLVDLVTDEGLWSLVIDDRAWAVRMSSGGASDIEAGTAGTLDGTTWVPAFEARSFDGLTDRIDFVHASEIGSGALTVAAWINCDSVATSLRMIWNEARSSDGAQSVIFRKDTTRLDFAIVNTGGGAVNLRRLSDTGQLTASAWHHVAITKPAGQTASAVRLFVDGTEVTGYTTTTNGVGTPLPGGIWALGGRVNTDANCFDGDIASADIWPRELEPEEIWHLYEEGIAAAGSFAGPPDDTPLTDNPGVVDTLPASGGPDTIAYPIAALYGA